MEFNGKNILVTGASRGIGKAIAQAFAIRGANIGIHYGASDMEANRTLASLGNDGLHHLFKYDLAVRENYTLLMQDFMKIYGHIDILVNNAGIVREHLIDSSDIFAWQKAWDDIMQVNLFAAADLSFLAANEMCKTGGGRIINVSSRGAYRGEPTMPAYGASKAAMNSLTQSLAKRLATHNIFVSGVAPGFTNTDMGAAALSPIEKDRLLAESPFKRMAKPEEVAHAVLFLASEGAEYSSGTIIDVNGASYLR